jgi:hypothetical protein
MPAREFASAFIAIQIERRASVAWLTAARRCFLPGQRNSRGSFARTLDDYAGETFAHRIG